MRLEEPAPGVAMIGAFNCAGAVMASVSLYFYGEDASDAAARAESEWGAWLAERFPAPRAAISAP